jgi:degradative hydroxymethylglutaryl-CoA reductase
MVENCIGKLSLPLGLGMNFLVNGKDLKIPMAIEEPSVIAAASGAAKIIKSFGGFKAWSTSSVMLGQIQLFSQNSQKTKDTVDENKQMVLGNSLVT